MARIDRGDADLPIIDADAPGLSARPVVVGRGPATRLRARSIGIALSALLVLTGGVAVGGLLEATPSPRPTEPDPTIAEPTKGIACRRPTTDELPLIVLVAAGTQAPVSASVRGFVDRAGSTSPRPGWQVPGGAAARGALRVESGTSIDLMATNSACIRRLLVETADAGLPDEPTIRERQRFDLDADPPAARIGLATLPDGDWVVRVITYFETGVAGLEGRLDIESYFRVRVGPGPFPNTPTLEPEPRPRVTPAAPCGPEPGGDEDVVISLSGPGVEAVPGAGPTAEPTLVTFRAGDEVVLAVAGEACAVAWEIRLRPEDGEVADVVEHETNRARDPRIAVQNGWQVTVPPGFSRLTIELEFQDGLGVAREWRIAGLGLTLPEIALVGADGSRITATPHCGLSVELANGYQAGDDCVVFSPPEDLEVLAVPAWSIVTLEVPDWTVVTWQGECGRLATEGGTPYFESLCGLGGYDVSGDAGPPGPPRFLARPGEYVVVLHLAATKDGDRFTVPVYAVVTGT